MNRAEDRPEVIRQHSGWLIPMGFLTVILILAALLLVYDLRPEMGPRDGMVSDTSPVALSVRGFAMAVPANYLDSAKAREGGEQDFLRLAALLPDLRGYSPEEARLFAGNAPDSPLVRLLFRGDDLGLDSAARLERIYRPYIEDAAGTPGDFGLTRYAFRPDSGYGRQDLFAGTEAGKLVLFLCERMTADLPSPNCSTTDRPLARNLSLSYRFKRAYLGRWREIVTGVDKLVVRLQAG